MHALIARLLLYVDYVRVSLGNAMKAKQSKAKIGMKERVTVTVTVSVVMVCHREAWTSA